LISAFEGLSISLVQQMKSGKVLLYAVRSKNTNYGMRS
jgi:hypothetical protein